MEKNSRRTREHRERKNKKKELPFGCSSRLTAALAFFLLLCVFVFVFVKWDILSPDSISKESKFADSTKETAAADLTGSTVLEKNIQAIDSGLIYISDTSIVQLNHDCERIFSEKHSFTNPMIRSSDKYSIAFNEGSGNYRIFYDEHKVHEGIQGSAITECDINDSGTYCILSDQTGYLSCLNVFDKSNNFIYSYSFSDYYAVSVAVSSDGGRVAVGAINSEDGRLVSKVYLLDITKDKPVNVFTYDDQIIFDIEFTSNDYFAVITDTHTSVIKIDGEKEVTYNYASQLLTAYDICFNNNIVLSLSKSEDGRSCTIITLDKDGHELESFSTDLKVVSVSALPDRTAVLSYGQLTLFNIYGDPFGEWEVGTDSKTVLLLQNKTAYILSVSDVTKLSLKY